MLSDKVFYYLCSDRGSDLKVRCKPVRLTVLVGTVLQRCCHTTYAIYSSSFLTLQFLYWSAALGVLNIKERREEMRKNQRYHRRRISLESTRLPLLTTFTRSVIRDYRFTTVIKLGKHYLKSARNPSIVQSLFQVWHSRPLSDPTRPNALNLPRAHPVNKQEELSIPRWHCLCDDEGTLEASHLNCSLLTLQRPFSWSFHDERYALGIAIPYAFRRRPTFYPLHLR